MSAPSVFVRLLAHLYGWALLAAPATARRERAEIVATLEEQLNDARGWRRRASVALRAFIMLPLVLAAEWREALLNERWKEPRSLVGFDLKYAARTLRKAPTFTWACVLLIGLGVGAVTTMFTIVDDVLLEPLPYPEADRLVYMSNGAHNGPTLRRLDTIDGFELWAAAAGTVVNLSRPSGEPLQLMNGEVTASFFPMFGARPLMGRLFGPEDDNDRTVAILSYSAWRTVWGADPNIVGSTIVVDEQPLTVVGVLTEDFVPPLTLLRRGVRSVDVLRPMNWLEPRLEGPGFAYHEVAARLGSDAGTAQAQLEVLGESLAAELPDYYGRSGPPVWPLEPLLEWTTATARGGLLLLLGSVALLLLVACVNVALLFLARGISRGREMALRRALGARGSALVAQLAAESLLVALAGSALGLLVARAGLTGFERWIGALPRAETIGMDERTFVFAVLLAIVVALVFGMVPALRALRRDVAPELREAGRNTTEAKSLRWIRGSLVIAETGVSFVLVAVAGLLLRSYVEVAGMESGVDAAGVWVVPLTPRMAGPEEYRTRMDGVATALGEIPGVESVTYGMEMPFEYVGGMSCCWYQSLTLPDESDVRTLIHPVSAPFFETFGIEIVAGRAWNSRVVDVDPRPVVVSQELAVRAFGSVAAAVGATLTFQRRPVQIVGVAEPTLHRGLDQIHPEAMYIPVEAFSMPGLTRGTFATSATFAFRTAPQATIQASSVRDAIWSVEPNLPVPRVVPLEDWIDGSSQGRRLNSQLAAAFGLLGLLLAAGGLYGSLLYAAGQRRREVGIRMALGAARRQVLGDVVARGCALAMSGIAVGLPVTWLIGRLLESRLFGVSRNDPVSLAAASLVLLAVALLASWLPAWRASRTDPLEVLRAD